LATKTIATESKRGEAITTSGDTVVHLPSLDMPIRKHFCSLQYWQRFRVTLFITQFLSLWHVYCIFFCTLRRKKPWK